LFAADNRQCAIADEIKGLPASTIAGLAVKARYTAEFALTSKEWGEDPGEMDYDKFAIRDLIENICALAGVDRFGRPVSEQGVVATN
jgi:hypothetical protein